MQVIPDNYYEGNLLDETLLINMPDGKPITLFIARKDGQVSAVAYEMSEPGYCSTLRVLIGLDTVLFLACAP